MKLIKALIIFFLSICSCINIFGQNPKLDSLLNVYKNSAHDSIRCRLMLEIGNQFQKQSPDTSLQWYNNAYKTATKTENHDEIFKLYAAGSLQASGCVERYYKGNYQKALEYTNKSFNIYQTIAAKSKSREIQKKAKKGMAEALMNIGNANWLQFSYNVAIEKYKQAAKLYKLLNDSSNLALAYSNLGCVHKDMSNYETEIEWHEQALKIRRLLNDKKGIGTSLNHIGSAYWYMRNNYKALEYYQRSLEMRQETGDESDIALSLDNIAMVFRDMGYFNEALAHYSESYALRKQLKDIKFIAISLNNIGGVYLNMNNYSKSVEFYLESLELREQLGDKKDIAATLNNIGNVYKNLSSYLKALEFYEKALDIRKSIGDKVLIAYTLNDIGCIYWSMKQYDKALKYHQEALEIRNETGDKAHIASSLKNIGLVYKDMDNFDSSLTNYQRGIELYKELKDNINITSVLNYMGNLYRKNGDFSVALNYYSQAYDISYDDNYYEGMAYTLLNIGELYNDRKNKQKAIQHFENALKLAEKLEDKELIRSIYKDLSDAYATTSDFVKAYEYYKLYSDFMDELLADESSKKIAEMQNRYEIGKKEKEIELMEKQKELDNKTIEAQQAKNRKQQIIIISSICGFLIVLVFSIIILRMFRQKRKANILLKRQNEEIRQQKEEIFIQRDEISAQRDKLSEQNSLLEEQKKEITDSINYAKRIQQAVLPTDEYAYSILGEHFILFKPKDIVSGDFYWGTLINEWLIVTVADCTGHGVPGAFMSMLGVSFLNEIVRKKEVTRACDVLNILREYIIEALQQKGKEGEQQDGMDIAFCAINSKTRVLQYAGAKNSLYIVSKDNSNEIKEFKADKMPVGIYMEMKPFTHNEICLNKDDIIYLSSDGYIDQFGGENRKKLLNKRFKEILLKVSKEPMNIQKEMLINEFENWKGEHEQIDDVTILGLKI